MAKKTESTYLFNMLGINQMMLQTTQRGVKLKVTQGYIWHVLVSLRRHLWLLVSQMVHSTVLYVYRLLLQNKGMYIHSLAESNCYRGLSNS